jgi:outer membrane receptor for ferrienterochelin and colicin
VSISVQDDNDQAARDAAANGEPPPKPATVPSVTALQDSDRMVADTIGYINNARVMTTRGIEVTVKQRLDFLPGPLKHLGGGINYAMTLIGGKNPDGSKATLDGVSRNSLNILGYYDTKYWSVRLTYNIRGKASLADSATTGFGGSARMTKPTQRLDGIVAIDLSKQIHLSFAAFNLLDSAKIDYQDNFEMPRRFNYDGRTYRIALNANF